IVTLNQASGGTSRGEIVVLSVPSMTIQADNSITGGEALKYTFAAVAAYPLADFSPNLSWDFGDSEKATRTPVAHIYRTPGQYVVRLSVIAGATSLILAQSQVAVPNQSNLISTSTGLRSVV